MFRNLFFIIVSLSVAFNLQAQIVITSDDMPVPGDTIRKSFTTFLDGIDYQPGGPDQTWLFDELTVISQQVDTFLTVEDTPGIYQIFFNNQFIYPDYNANVALKLAQFSGIPGLTLADSYQFLIINDDEYREVGYGVSIEGVQIPVQLQEIDTIYRFPLEYGNIDSAHSLLEIDIPNLGFLMVSKFRRNTVDGWGTLTTPFGEFETLRMKTEIMEYDSLFSDSLGIGFPVIRNIIEYKWFANGYHEPLLVVSEEPFLITATYIDSVRTSFVSVSEVKKNKFNFTVYPNPCKSHFTVDYELKNDAEVKLSVCSVYGCELIRLNLGRQEQGYYKQVIYLTETGVPAGIYFVRLMVDNIPYARKIIAD
jgi:hypothetical protein